MDAPAVQYSSTAIHNDYSHYLIVVRRVSHVKYGVTFIQMRSVLVSDTSVNNDMKFYSGNYVVHTYKILRRKDVLIDALIEVWDLFISFLFLCETKSPRPHFI